MISMKKESLVLFYLLSFTWGLLYTAVGIVVLIFIMILMPGKIRLSTARGRIRVHFKYKAFGGASLGIVIITSGNFYNHSLINHEIGHSIQNAWFGPAFPFIVAIPSAIRYQMWDYLVEKHNRKDYDAIWFEGQATRLGDIYF